MEYRLKINLIKMQVGHEYRIAERNSTRINLISKNHCGVKKTKESIGIEIENDILKGKNSHSSSKYNNVKITLTLYRRMLQQQNQPKMCNEQLNSTINELPTNEIIILLGSMNAKIGQTNII